jgi:hypothetical protein
MLLIMPQNSAQSTAFEPLAQPVMAGKTRIRAIPAKIDLS